MERRKVESLMPMMPVKIRVDRSLSVKYVCNIAI